MSFRRDVMARLAVGAALVLGAAAGLPGLADAGDFRIVDAQGRVVGTFVSMEDGLAKVLFPAEGGAAALLVGRDGFLAGDFTGAVFDTDDCTGEPRLLALDVILPATLSPTSLPAGVTPDNRVVVPTAAGPSATTVESQWRPQSVPPCDPSPTGMVATRPTTAIGPPFVSPFTLLDHRPGEGAGRGDRIDGLEGVAVDGAGARLGRLGGVEPPAVATVLFPVGDDVAPVTMLGNRALLGTAAVVYVANNCTGVPFLALPPGPVPMFPLVGVDVAGALLRDAGPAAPIVVGSESDPFDLVSPCDVVGVGPARPVQATAVLDDLTARPLPFATALAERGPAGSPGARGSRRLAVEDAAGQLVGVAFTGFETPLVGVVVFHQVGGRGGEVRVAAGQFIAGSREALFETSDCSGPAYVTVSPTEPAPLTPLTALGPGSTLLSADGPLEVVDLQFRWVHETATCQPDAVGPGVAQRMSALSNLSRFSLPLVIR